MGRQEPRRRCGDPAALRIVIYGTGGFARELYQWLRDLRRDGHRVLCEGFLVDDAYRKDAEASGLSVFGNAHWLRDNPHVLVVIGVGATAARSRIASQIDEGQLFTLVHPAAVVGEEVVLGAGSAAAPNAIATTNIVTGRNVQLHVASTVGHDTRIGDFVTLAPGANISGRVQIGDGAFIGTGAVILPDVRIGRWSIVGAGAVVTQDVEDNVTTAGIPAASSRGGSQVGT